MESTKYESVYDIPLASADGEENFLAQYRGRVTLFANTTGDCGNAPQFGIIEQLYQDYKDRGFQVVAVPTNDYCGFGVTYGIYEDGIRDAKTSEDFGREKYGVTYPFTELVTSREDRDEETDGRKIHDLYNFLNPDGEKAPINGNFEKFIVDKHGKRIARLANGILLNYAHESGYCDPPEVELERLRKIIEAALDEEYIESQTQTQG
jgi:glutathione peroxidase